MNAREGHWFDRLAVRRTRREVLIGAIAGGAALGVSAIDPAASRADDPRACQTGCAWTAHQHYAARNTACFNGASLANGYFTIQFAAAFGIFNPTGAVTGAWKASDALFAKCRELAFQLQKGEWYNCLQPNCPGFDPKGSGGPCETCGASCCPDPTVVSGYSCCTLGCACGADAGACHASVTPC